MSTRCVDEFPDHRGVKMNLGFLNQDDFRLVIEGDSQHIGDLVDSEAVIDY